MGQKPERMYLVGVFGDPVDENPSYIMEEAAFRAAGLNWRYLNLRVKAADLAKAVEGVRVMNFSGFNVTMPHKVKIVPLLDRVADDAKLIGAVNTVWRDGDEFIGENTDGKGFLTSLIEDGEVKAKGEKNSVYGSWRCRQGYLRGTWTGRGPAHPDCEPGLRKRNGSLFSQNTAGRY